MQSQRPWQRVVWSVVILGLVGLGGSALWYWQGLSPRVGGERPLEGLGNFGTVPTFSLTERSGRRVTREDLQGMVWVTNFIYSNCPDSCPLQSTKMARLQQDFADHRDVRLVSISVDPQHDTLDVLQDYAQRFGADPERWLFLTGDKTAIYRLAQEGFHLSVVDPNITPPQTPEAAPKGALPGSRGELRSSPREARCLSLAPLEMLWQWAFIPRQAWAHGGVEHTTVLHSSRFVLVDRQARIRGYYHSHEEAALQRLRRDVRTLLRER